MTVPTVPGGSPSRHKFAGAWASLSTTAYAEYPREPWRALKPDESVCHLRIDLQNATRADVSREVRCSRSAVTRAKQRLDGKLHTFRLRGGDRTSHKPPRPSSRSRFGFKLDGGSYAVHVAGRNFIMERLRPSIVEIMSDRDVNREGFGFIGFGRTSTEDWGQRRHRPVNAKTTFEWGGEVMTVKLSDKAVEQGLTWADFNRFVQREEKHAGDDVRRMSRHALDADIDVHVGSDTRGRGLTREMYADGMHLAGKRGEGGMEYDPSDKAANDFLRHAERSVD